MNQGLLVASLLAVWIATPFVIGWALRRDRISERTGAIAILGVAPASVVAYGIISDVSPAMLVIVTLAAALPAAVLYRPLLTFMADHRRRG